MRDIFEEIFENQPLDPTESARRSMRPKLRARFYQAATVGEGAEGFQVLLDGWPPRKSDAGAGFPRCAGAELAEAPLRSGALKRDACPDLAGMPLTRLANSITHGAKLLLPHPLVAAEIEKYLGTDLLFYRAAAPDGLVASQRRIGTRSSNGRGKHSARALCWSRA